MGIGALDIAVFDPFADVTDHVIDPVGTATRHAEIFADHEGGTRFASEDVCTATIGR